MPLSDLLQDTPKIRNFRTPDIALPLLRLLAGKLGVGRNAIYTNHRALLDQLRQSASKTSPKAAEREDKLVEQRAMIEGLKLNERRMITENAVLLKVSSF